MRAVIRTGTSIAAGLVLAGALVAAAPSATATAPQAGSAARANACSPAVGIASFSDALDKTTFDGTFVGNLSALATERNGDLDALSDRSALFTLDARTRQPKAVLPLADETGQPLDSEGLVVDRDGTRLITSEVEPSIRRYSPDGKIVDSLPVPAALRVAPAGRATSNATFEGLTLQPDGRTLVASMEQPLSGDQADLVRFQTWQRGRGEFALGPQYAYREDLGLGVSETTATGDGRLLVLERGFTAGVGNTVRLYLADPRGASDVSGVATLSGQAVRLMTKTPLADLEDCPSLGATAKQPQLNPLLDNIEGMTVLGGSPAGRLKVLLVSDDNQGATQITRLYQLTVNLPRG